jgi:hypothetical protein
MYQISTFSALYLRFLGAARAATEAKFASKKALEVPLPASTLGPVRLISCAFTASQPGRTIVALLVAEIVWTAGSRPCKVPSNVAAVRLARKRPLQQLRHRLLLSASAL